MINGKCRLCGAERKINNNTGNLMWVRDGQILATPEDAKQAFIKMAEVQGIPVSQWPDKYKE
jgi:hypothetical protein